MLGLRARALVILGDRRRGLIGALPCSQTLYSAEGAAADARQSPRRTVFRLWRPKGFTVSYGETQRATDGLNSPSPQKRAGRPVRLNKGRRTYQKCHRPGLSVRWARAARPAAAQPPRPPASHLLRSSQPARLPIALRRALQPANPRAKWRLR